MKTVSVRNMGKQGPLKWTSCDASLPQRFLSFLLRDLVPTVIMLALFIFGASFVAEKIDEAKASRVVGMAEDARLP